MENVFLSTLLDYRYLSTLSASNKLAYHIHFVFLQAARGIFTHFPIFISPSHTLLGSIPNCLPAATLDLPNKMLHHGISFN